MLQGLADAGLTTEAVVRLQRLRIADHADALARISPEAQDSLLEALPSQHLGTIVEELETEEAIAVCERLPAGLPMSLMRQVPMLRRMC